MAFLPRFTGLSAMYNQPHTLPDFRSRPWPLACGCSTCAHLRARGHTNFYHVPDGVAGDTTNNNNCNYNNRPLVHGNFGRYHFFGPLPPPDQRSHLAAARENLERRRRQVLQDMVKVETKLAAMTVANGDFAGLRFAYEIRDLRLEIAHLALLMGRMLNAVFNGWDYEYEDEDDEDDDDGCCSDCCSGCASDGPADVKQQQQQEEDGTGKGKEKEVQQQQEPGEELVVPTLVHEEETGSKEKETVAAKSESAASEGLSASA
ncbi:hypothetical protein PG997_015305 [Apiospora hydei]|uniref:Uncharacterized protein n=1 Tax=Apiospora hydei TaxID=1337664 RepID=A0ABR1UTE7_9PEZI